ncbi:hypothetical protein [Paenibacillus thiaminolyticus]|uniref:Uncharacterized protein n=1 Tax=Paenibacillus thiaminolyticus TaxID=49283 RepID=A0A3A3GBF5_PANTH|nr:hypothetical protein [Paenibacillus thiaminolyticus]RJG19155.1 hypothetical protein DQX05_26215 [Paenibacillus thiaminolyticus]
MNTEEFENWVSIHSIIECTKKGFWNYMENYKQEEPDEFSEVFGSVDMDVEYEGEELGVYQCLFSLDGDDLDDYFR